LSLVSTGERAALLRPRPGPDEAAAHPRGNPFAVRAARCRGTHRRWGLANRVVHARVEGLALGLDGRHRMAFQLRLEKPQDQIDAILDRLTSFCSPSFQKRRHAPGVRDLQELAQHRSRALTRARSPPCACASCSCRTRRDAKHAVLQLGLLGFQRGHPLGGLGSADADSPAGAGDRTAAHQASRRARASGNRDCLETRRSRLMGNNSRAIPSSALFTVVQAPRNHVGCEDTTRGMTCYSSFADGRLPRCSQRRSSPDTVHTHLCCGLTPE